VDEPYSSPTCPGPVYVYQQEVISPAGASATASECHGTRSEEQFSSGETAARFHKRADVYGCSADVDGLRFRSAKCGA
jgi:hypothetical protein